MTLEDKVRPGLLRVDVPIGELTTYKLGGPARYFAEPGSEAELLQLVGAARSEEIPVLFLGRGSNLVVSDEGWPGLAVRLAGEFLEVTVPASGLIVAGGAVPLPRLARMSVESGRGGLEFYVGIPGSVGGAVRMNAGGHGSSTSDVLHSARVWLADNEEPDEIGVGDLGFDYRRSRLGSADVVISATFRTTQSSVEAGSATLREITRWRRENQPGGTLNAGSVFKNPPGAAAGRIIDRLGLKGFSVGGASVSVRHANFFEAAPDASARDLYRLVATVRQIVHDETGIDLEPEIQFAGAFDED